MLTIEQSLPTLQLNGNLATRLPVIGGHATKASVSTGATLTAAQVSTGYIVNTGTGSTLTLPTGTLLGNYLGAAQGDTFDLYIDNTGGTASTTLTIAVSTNAIQSAFGGTLTLVSGTTGLGCFKIMFASPTAYVFSRIA